MAKNGFYNDETYKTVCCWTADTQIKYVPNPKWGKSRIRYAGYENAKTVGEALSCGSFPMDLLFDFQTGKLSVTGGSIRDEPIDPSKAETATDKLLSKWYYRAHPAKLQNLRDMEQVLKEKNLSSMTLRNQAKAVDLSERLGIQLDEFSEGILTELDAARKMADSDAQHLLEQATANGRKIADSDVLSILRKWMFRKNDARLNVMPEGTNFVFSDTLGLLRTRDGRYIATEPTVTFPNVFALFNQWLRDNRPAQYDRDFPFTSISVNSAYAARIHRDQNNHGPSIGVAFGDFEGGRLEYWHEDDKSLDFDQLLSVPHSMMETGKGQCLFDGRRAHAVEPFTGERFSLVFFSIGKYWKAKQDVRDFLTSHRLEFPTDGSMKYYIGQLPAAKGYKALGIKPVRKRAHTETETVITPKKRSPTELIAPIDEQQPDEHSKTPAKGERLGVATPEAEEPQAKQAKTCKSPVEGRKLTEFFHA